MTWIWVNFGSWWWIARPGVLQSLGSQRVGHDQVTELNWIEELVVFPFLWTICVHLLLKFLLSYWSFHMDLIGDLHVWDKLAIVCDLSCKYFSECWFLLCFFPWIYFLFENNRIYHYLLSGLFFSFFMLRTDSLDVKIIKDYTLVSSNTSVVLLFTL